MKISIKCINYFSKIDVMDFWKDVNFDWLDSQELLECDLWKDFDFDWLDNEDLLNYDFWKDFVIFDFSDDVSID